ncbi:MAG: type IV secretory system conjugative DNA transfer family protein, partial [Ruthenibacterium sp.]
MHPVILLISAAVVMFCIIGGLSMLAHYYTLSGIKSKTVGDGQHGTAEWAGKKEIQQVYRHIPFDVPNWR